MLEGTEMATLNIKSNFEEINTIKGFLTEGLEEGEKRIHFAIETTESKLKKYEEKYGISTSEFIEKFNKKEFEENDDTFTWWAEEKLLKELKQKLSIIIDIKICQS